MSQENSPLYDIDVFDEDFFADTETDNHQVIGLWGKRIFHCLKLLFVVYSGAHNVNASIAAAGNSPIAAISQIIGVLVLEATLLALYMAGIGGYITGTFQALVAAVFWCIGMILASMGIVADSRLNAGQELGSTLEWYTTTGLYLAPVVMIVGVAVVVFSDPVLLQHIMNAKDKAALRRDRVKAIVLSERAEHQAQKVVQNIRLGTQKQLARYAREFYKSDQVQQALEEIAVQQLSDLMRQSGIPLPLTSTNGEQGSVDEDTDPLA